MKKRNILAYIGHNHDKDRVKNDFYPTPSNATYELLKKEKLKIRFLKLVIIINQFTLKIQKRL